MSKAAPVLSWATPTAVPVGTALSAAQLSATANIPGTFTYSPASGTVLTTAGSFALTGVFTPTDASDYLPGSATVFLSVGKGTPVINWNSPASVPQGTQLSSVQLNASSNVAGTFSYTPAPGTVLSTVGSNTLSVTFTPTDTNDYNSASASVAIMVNAPTPLITWPVPAAVTVGSRSPRRNWMQLPTSLDRFFTRRLQAHSL